jgi:uncharacterized membrane protein YhaH (DUF805 family)
MDIQTAVKTCFNKYATFSGRASRSEYWWWTLFVIIANVILTAVDFAIGFGEWGLFSNIFSLATLIPSIAVGARRLHDVNKSGWWQLLAIVPLVGWIILLIWVIKKGSIDENRFGPAVVTVSDFDPAN